MDGQSRHSSRSTGSGSFKPGPILSRSTQQLPETVAELHDWADTRPYWNAVEDAAAAALDEYPHGGITADVPPGNHPVLFAADVLHAMSLMAPSWGINFNLEEVAGDHFQRTPPNA